MNKQQLSKKQSEIEQAMRYWSNDLQLALDSKFGKSKLGHIIVVFDFGHSGRTMSWISNARLESLIQLVEAFLKKLKNLHRLIITPKETEDGHF